MVLKSKDTVNWKMKSKDSNEQGKGSGRGYLRPNVTPIKSIVRRALRNEALELLRRVGLPGHTDTEFVKARNVARDTQLGVVQLAALQNPNRFIRLQAWDNHAGLKVPVIRRALASQSKEDQADRVIQAEINLSIAHYERMHKKKFNPVWHRPKTRMSAAQLPSVEQPRPTAQA